jgi:flagellar export protein FliJ
MARSTFRLQPLLKLREAARDRCREELAHAYQADQLLHDRQQAIVRDMEHNRKRTYVHSLPGQIDVDGLLSAHRYELLLTTQLRQLAHQREKVGQEIERRRQALVQADREVRILEKLRTRHALARRQREEREELRQLDEVALRRSGLTRRGGD